MEPGFILWILSSYFLGMIIGVLFISTLIAWSGGEGDLIIIIKDGPSHSWNILVGEEGGINGDIVIYVNDRDSENWRLLLGDIEEPILY